MQVLHPQTRNTQHFHQQSQQLKPIISHLKHHEAGQQAFSNWLRDQSTISDTMADLFFGCIAAPSKLTAGASGIERWCLLYFAAYSLTSGGRMSVRGLEHSDRSILLAAEMRRVVVWLLDQMPDHAFASEIEQIFIDQRRVI